MRYKGLILGQQDEVEVDTEHWKFGIVRHGAKVVDTTLHYTAFPLAYDDHGIIDKVCARLKDYKPLNPNPAYGPVNYDAIWDFKA